MGIYWADDTSKFTGELTLWPLSFFLVFSESRLQENMYIGFIFCIFWNHITKYNKKERAFTIFILIFFSIVFYLNFLNWISSFIRWGCWCPSLLVWGCGLAHYRHSDQFAELIFKCLANNKVFNKCYAPSTSFWDLKVNETQFLLSRSLIPSGTENQVNGANKNLLFKVLFGTKEAVY